MAMRRYDFILAGGGAAGLSLAHYLVNSSLVDRSILIVDRDTKLRNDRTWSFWTDQPTPFDSIVCASWDRLRVAFGESVAEIPLGTYRYRTIHGVDFYQFVRRELADRANVDLVVGDVEQVEDGAGGARVVVDGTAYEGDWIFDSRSTYFPDRTDWSRYRQAWQRFVGADVKALDGAFDPAAATFMDFRTPQDGAVRFFYVLPFSQSRAMVEYVAIGGEPPRPSVATAALAEYLESTLTIHRYDAHPAESGASLMTDRPFPRRLGRRIMAIGARGGRIKPGSGFAFARIQHDSLAIVRSLRDLGHPFAVPPDSPRYRLFDLLLLEVIARRPAAVEQLLGIMFLRNPIGRVLRFLDEAGSPWENFQLIVTMPALLYLSMLVRSKAGRRFLQWGPGGI
jgi:lycopene beta-cyclase